MAAPKVYQRCSLERGRVEKQYLWYIFLLENGVGIAELLRDAGAGLRSLVRL
jgi:hypothetical protein